MADVNSLVEGVRDSLEAVSAMVTGKRETQDLDALREGQRELKDAVVELNATLVRQHHWQMMMWRGLVTGMATAIGATVVAAIVLSIFVRVARTTGIDRFIPDDIRLENIRER